MPCLSDPIARPRSGENVGAEPMTLATVLAALEHDRTLAATRRRDLRSAVKRIADLTRR